MKIPVPVVAGTLVCTVLVAVTVLFPDQRLPSTYERYEITQDRMVEYLGGDRHGEVTACFPFPTNNPITYMVDAIVVKEKGRKYRCVGYSPILLTNGTPILVRELRFTDAGGGRMVTFVFPVE